MEVVTEQSIGKTVPEGYKRTEVGVIPEDWDIIKFSEAFSFLKTGTNSRSDLSDNGEVYYIHYGDIHAKWQNTLDFKNDKVPLIATEKVKGLPFLEEGDLIIADASEDYEGVGASVEVKNLNGEKAVAGLHTILLRNDGTLADNYKAYITRIDGVRESLLKICTGTTVYGISKSKLKEVKLPLPTLEEQRAIAGALSDVDALIAELDALIEKKQQVKKGAMQQLLTGKKRLPGFDGKWEEKKLGDVCNVVNGGTPSTRNTEYWNGKIPWCTPTDITSTNGRYISKTERNITEAGLKSSSASLLPKGALLLCSRATVGEIKIAGTKITTNQGIKSLICSDEVNNEFLYYLIILEKQKFIDKAFGSTFLEISKKNTQEVKFVFPEIEEQCAIAQILSDMDVEIQALRAKRSKYEKIKQGMMQELLTGKTRLV